MQHIQWDDYRVAYQVAQSGSLSKAAVQLQCNHATVLRHINRLEQALNIKLFIRHQRGYRLTDAGKIMVNELPGIYEEFNRLESLMGGVEQDISGNLRITTLVEFSPLLNPAIMKLRTDYPKLRIQLLSTEEVIPLASGAVHVSLRAGPEPLDPDLIARKIMSIDMSCYAADSYVAAHGLPLSPSEFNQHEWVMLSADKHRIANVKELSKLIDVEQVVYQSNHFLDIEAAVISGMGIGLMTNTVADNTAGVQKIDIETMINWEAEALWFVYHRDLKRNAKVQTLYRYLTDNLSSEHRKD